jgi:hypothetical protein
VSASEACLCPECRKAGVSRPAVAPLGQTLHGRALEDYWRAREQFEATVAALKDPALAEAAKKLGGGE